MNKKNKTKEMFSEFSSYFYPILVKIDIYSVKT